MPHAIRKTLLSWATEFGVDYLAFLDRALKTGVLTKAKRVRGVAHLSRAQADKCWPWGRAARERARRRPGVKKRYDWTDVDWRMKDIEIAEQLGCSDVAVSAMRRRRGKPKASTHGRKRWLMATNPRIDAALRAAGPHETDRAIARELGVNERHVGRRRHLLGIPTVRPRPSFWSSLVDWRLVDQDIKTIWKVKVVGCSRDYHAGKVRPLFSYDREGARGRARYRERMSHRRYVAIYRAQVALAKRHRSRPKRYQRY